MLTLLDPPDKMNSISPECQELKEKYDACFNKWFSEKFLKGNTKDECSALFEVYQECVKVCFLFCTSTHVQQYVNLFFFFIFHFKLSSHDVYLLLF